MTKDRILQIFKLAFSLAIIIWLSRSGNLDFSSMKYVLSAKYLIPCILLTLIMLLLNHYRWWLLLNAMNFKFSYWKSFSVTLFANFMNFVMPGSVGGDVLKVYFVAKENKSRRIEGGTTVVIDRLLGLFVMVCLAFIGMFLNIELVMQNLWLKSIFAGLLTILIVMLTFLISFFVSESNLFQKLENLQSHQNRILRLVAKTFLSLRAYREHRNVILATIALSVISQMTSLLFFAVVGMALGESLPFHVYIFAVFLGFIVSAVPLAPGGVGVGQVAFLFFFKVATGLDLKVGTLGITISQVILFFMGALGFLIFIRNYSFKKSDLEMAT